MRTLKISCTRNIMLITLVSFALTGCFDKGPDTGPVQTVDWYKSHNEERQSMLETCANNPGELKDDSNCVNARAAEHNLSLGKPRNIW